MNKDVLKMPTEKKSDGNKILTLICIAIFLRDLSIFNPIYQPTVREKVKQISEA